MDRRGRRRQRDPMHWMDIAIPVGLTAWVFLFVRQLRRVASLNDPYLKEALR